MRGTVHLAASRCTLRCCVWLLQERVLPARGCGGSGEVPHNGRRATCSFYRQADLVHDEGPDVSQEAAERMRSLQCISVWTVVRWIRL